jgi:hypothetical protein
MLFTAAIPFVFLIFSGQVAASPLTKAPVSKRTDSLNSWGGFSSLDGFDDFNGVDNFSGRNDAETVVIQETQVVCSSLPVRVIQQQLAILQEVAKQILTTQICEVEVQTIVFQQFSSGFDNFSGDLSRQSGKQVGFDPNVAKLIGSLINDDGSLNRNDFGFQGNQIGGSKVVANSNWNDESSPASVQAALNAALQAAGINNGQ